jgi:hypothetical protein
MHIPASIGKHPIHPMLAVARVRHSVLPRHGFFGINVTTQHKVILRCRSDDYGLNVSVRLSVSAHSGTSSVRGPGIILWARSPDTPKSTSCDASLMNAITFFMTDATTSIQKLVTGTFA